ncbi:MAG TPA: hypothetical protein DDY22_07510 [Geobacter sp.]|nr:hypothetical protein [Geobacter sp.]
MKYYIINTDKRSFEGMNDISVWLDNDLAFTGGPARYLDELTRLEVGDICLMYENEIGIVAVGRVLSRCDRQAYLPPMYYDKPDMPEYRAGVHWFLHLTRNPLDISRIRELFEYDSPWAPSRVLTSVTNCSEKVQLLIKVSKDDREFYTAEEVSGQIEIVEGAKTTITVNAYERNTAARRICIDHWGARCAVCEMEFEQVYGPLGLGFIHVHHLTPVATIGRQYALNPQTDLRPVCPNCHSMLHKKTPPYKIEELREIIAEVNLTA